MQVPVSSIGVYVQDQSERLIPAEEVNVIKGNPNLF